MSTRSIIFSQLPTLSAISRLGQYAPADCANPAGRVLVQMKHHSERNAMGENLFKPQDVRRIVIISALTFWSTCLIVLRIARTGSRYYLFLIWNLFLAGIPLVASTS